MKKDHTLYVISRVVKGRREYLVEDLETFTSKLNKAYLFDSKKEAIIWMRTAMTYNMLMYCTARREYLPTYDLLSVTMKLNKESYQL